jgi:hypothetical protein
LIVSEQKFVKYDSCLLLQFLGIPIISSKTDFRERNRIIVFPSCVP